MRHVIKEKLKAFTIHLALSLLVLSSFLLYAFYIWYPAPYYEVAGLDRITAILIAVDLVLGPTLTFLLYRKGKPRLKFDLTLIAIVQLAALAYGMNTIYEGHPAYVVFAVDRFELVPVTDVDPGTAKHEEFKTSTLWKPVLAFAKIPEEREERNKLLFEVVVEQKPGVERRPQYYEPIGNHLNDMLRRAMKPEKLLDSPEIRKHLADFLRTHKGKMEDYAFFPLVGKSKDLIVAIRRETGEMTGTLPIDPWNYY